jgi:hypothetical protein
VQVQDTVPCIAVFSELADVPPPGAEVQQSPLAKCPDHRAVSSGRHVWAVETRLPGWAYKIRTAESGRGPPDWICVTIRPEVGGDRDLATDLPR